MVDVIGSSVAIAIERFPGHPSTPIDGDFVALLPYKTEPIETQTLIPRPITPPPIAPCNKTYDLTEMRQVVTSWKLYYSKFDKDQTFIFVCRRSCLSDTKHFMIDM